MNRKSIIRAYVLLGALATLLPMHGMAQNLYSPAALLKINNIESVWRVNADATSTVESYVEREALSDAGAQVIGKFSQIINQALQKFEVLEAYTLKANGRRIPVSKDSILNLPLLDVPLSFSIMRPSIAVPRASFSQTALG